MASGRVPTTQKMLTGLFTLFCPPISESPCMTYGGDVRTSAFCEGSNAPISFHNVFGFPRGVLSAERPIC